MTKRARKKNPRRWVYDFYDQAGELIGTVYSDEEITAARARTKMIGKLLSEGDSFEEADDAIDLADIEIYREPSLRELAARTSNPDHWRPVGSSGYFPDWLRKLKKRSGVYAIRDAKSGEVLYVGESHTDQLYKTITRHFQQWDGYTAGTTYRRSAVEVSVQPTSASEAERKQLDWIETLAPRDNKYGQPVEDVDPRDFMDGADDDGARSSNPSGPSHRIPARTVELGEVLDLVVELNGERLIYRDEVRGMWLLAPDNAMDRAEGGGRLYLVRGELAGGRDPEDARPEGQRTFERWHQSHGPDQIGSLEVPDSVGVPVGRAVRIGYKSDKFGGKTAAYEHDFESPFPKVYATRKDNPKALVIVGGGFTVSPRGIVG